MHPGKNLGALGDAGAFTSDDDHLPDGARMLRNYSSNIKYDHELPVLNSRLDSLQAAFRGVKRRRPDDFNDRRRAIAARYPELLDGDLRLPAVPE